MTEDSPTAIDIRAIRFSKSQLLRLSPALQELFVRLGLAMNDLLFLQRLYLACGNTNPVSEAASHASGSHQTTVFLLLAGKLFEAIGIFEKWFLQSPLATQLLPHLEPEQAAAVKALKALCGARGKLAKIRNNFAFHYHDAPLRPQIEAIQFLRALQVS